jgi:hypothetical protein
MPGSALESQDINAEMEGDSSQGINSLRERRLESSRADGNAAPMATPFPPCGNLSASFAAGRGRS